MRCLRGRLSELLAQPVETGSRDDYLRVTLEDEEPLFDPMGKLREVYPNVLELDRPFLAAAPEVGRLGDHRRLDEADLFDGT